MNFLKSPHLLLHTYVTVRNKYTKSKGEEEEHAQLLQVKTEMTETKYRIFGFN